MTSIVILGLRSEAEECRGSMLEHAQLHADRVNAIRYR